MKHFFKFFFLFLMLLVAKESMALTCLAQPGNGQLVTEAISREVKIFPETPLRTVVWRSITFSVSIKCWNERYTPQDDYIFIYMGSYHSANPSWDIGGKLEPGIRIGDRDYYCSDNAAQQGCAINTWQGVPKCLIVGGCPNVSTTINLTFSTFFAVKEKGAPNQEGNVANNNNDYPMVQFRGFHTNNSNNTSNNWTFFIRNIAQIKYAGCASTVDVQPRSIEFPSASASRASTGSTIHEHPLTITATKTCSTPYGLAGVFIPEDGLLSTDSTTLLPTNNDSVGIQIVDIDSDQVLPFRDQFTIAPLGNTQLHVQKNLQARLIWMKDKATPGPFNATAKLEVYYK